MTKIMKKKCSLLLNNNNNNDNNSIYNNNNKVIKTIINNNNDYNLNNCQKIKNMIMENIYDETVDDINHESSSSSIIINNNNYNYNFDHRKRKSRRINLSSKINENMNNNNNNEIKMKYFIWIRAWLFDDDNDDNDGVKKYWPPKLPIWSSSPTLPSSSSYLSSSTSSKKSSILSSSTSLKKFSQPYYHYVYLLMLLLFTINSFYVMNAVKILNNDDVVDVIQQQKQHQYHHNHHPYHHNFHYLNNRNNQHFLPHSSSSLSSPINHIPIIFTPFMSHQQSPITSTSTSTTNNLNNDNILLDDSMITLKSSPYHQNINNFYRQQQYYHQQQPNFIPKNYDFMQNESKLINQNLTNDNPQQNQSMIILNGNYLPPSKKCSANEFECIRDSTCINLSSVGDGIMDCIDGSDECPDPIRQFRCRCGLPICIDRIHYMDGQINCDDGSDEGLLVNICQDYIQNELLPNGMLTNPIIPSRKPNMQQPHSSKLDVDIPIAIINDVYNDNNDPNLTTTTIPVNENKYMAEEIDDPILLLPENLEELFSSEFFDAFLTPTLTPPPSSSITIDLLSSKESNNNVSESNTKNNDENDDDDENIVSVTTMTTTTTTTTTLSFMSSTSSIKSLDEQQITPNSTMKKFLSSTIMTTSTTSTTQDVIELTGTFLPYELLTNPTKYPYYHRSMVTPPIRLEKLTDTNSIVEITGTFIPAETMTQSFDNIENIRPTQPMTTTATTKTSTNTYNMTETNDEKKSKFSNNKIFKQATNQTFIIGNRRLMILTGIFFDPQNNNNNSDSGVAFIVACGENRIHRSLSIENTGYDRICDNVPIKIQNERSKKTDERKIYNNNQHNNGTLLINLASSGKSLIIIPLFTNGSSSSNNMKMIHAEIELNFNDNNQMNKTNLLLTGLGWKNISKIEVNSDRKYVPYTVKDLQQSIVNVKFDNKKQLSNVQIIENDDNNQFQSKLLSLSSSPVILSTTTSSSLSSLSSISSNYYDSSSKIRSRFFNRPRMHTTTVGRFGKQDEEKKSLLDSYFNGNIPQYDPTVIVEPTSLSITSKTIRATSTIFGFIDFTTLVNGTMLIFTPKTKVETSEKKYSKIKPTKIASINNFQTISPTIIDKSSISSLYDDEKDKTSTTKINLESVSLKKNDDNKYNEYIVTSDGVTITNGFILPSFSSSIPNLLQSKTTDNLFNSATIASQSSLSSSSTTSTKPLKLIATTYTTKHTDFITEQIDGELRTRTSEIISTNVIYNSINDYDNNLNEHLLYPTKPLKTFFTTYTYYTTFKNSETEFVHSRKEIVTNIVDPDENVANIISSKTLSPSSTLSSSSILFTNSIKNNNSTSSDIQLIDTRPLSSSSSLSSSMIKTMNNNNDDNDDVDYNKQQMRPTPSLQNVINHQSFKNSNKPTSLNKTYLGKLLSGIAVPITHYTTFTYYTTFFKDSTSQIVSRTNVISNIVTGTINLNQTPFSSSSLSIQKRSIKNDDELIFPAAAENFPIVITPVTEFSTSTLYTTFFVPGQGSTVVTNTHIYSNTYLPDVDDLVRITSSSEHQVQRPTKMLQNYPFITTINYDSPSVERIQELSPTINKNQHKQQQHTAPITAINQKENGDGIVRHINGIPVLDNQIVFNTNTQNRQQTVVPFIPQSVREQRLSSSSSLARIEIEGSNNDDNIETLTNSRRKVIKVTKTRKLSHTFNNNDNERLKSTVIIRRPQSSMASNINKNDQSNTILIDQHYHEIEKIKDRTGRLYSSITPTPVTYYTTYTYFTTELIDGRPVVRSNEHLFSTVITGKILPTRVIPDQHLRRIRRTLIEDSFINKQNSFNNNNNDDHKSSVIAKDDDKRKNNQHQPSSSSRKIGVVSEMTNKNGDKTFLTQIIGTMINGFYAQFAITKTLEPSTLIPIQTSVSFIQPEPKLNLTSENLSDDIDDVMIDNIDTTTEISNNIDEDTITTTEKPLTAELLANEVENFTEDTMIDDSWLSDENVSDEKFFSLISSSIEPVFSSSIETPKLSSSFQQIMTNEKPIESTLHYRTGLLSSTIETLTDFDRQELIYLTKEIFGTYIGGIYAHLAKTRSETFTLQTQLSTSLSMFHPDITATETTTTTTTSTSTTLLAPSNLFSGSLDPVSLNVTTIPTIANELNNINATFVMENATVINIDESSSKNISDSFETIITSSPTFEVSSTSIFTSSSSTVSIDENNNNDNDDDKKQSSIDLWPSLPGLSSISYATGTLNDTLLVVHTTEFYTTQINGFTAHYSRETYNSIGTIDPTTATTETSSKPSVHFPTPVRFLFSTSVQSQTPQVFTTFVTVTTTLIDESAQNSGLIQSESNSWLASRKFKPNFNNNNNNNDNNNNNNYNNNNQELDDGDVSTYLLSSSSSEQMPRSRTIREKNNAQPFIDYEDDVDYADQIDSNPQSYFFPSTSSTTTTTTTKAPKTLSRNSYWQPRRNVAGFGQRVGSSSSSSSLSTSSSLSYFNDQESNTSNQRIINNNNRGFLPRRRTQQQQSTISRSTASSPVATSATRSLEFYHFNDNNQNNPSRFMPDDRTRSILNTQNNNRSQHFDRNNKNYSRNRGFNRVRSFHTIPTTMSTTTTTPAPRNINLLPNQRLRLNRKYSRNRLPHLKKLNRDYSKHSSSTYQRSAQSEAIDQPRKFGRGNFRPRPLQQTNLQPSTLTSTVYSTQILPKLPITVTSIATTIKTVPIFHGFRTSYATLTTTTLNTSIIPHTLYETSVGEDGTTRTLFTRMTDQFEPHKVTEILITTSALQEVKLVPIKYGYSTRTETLTDVKTFTMLTTVVSTDSSALLSHLLPPPPGSTFSTTTYVTEHTLSSTTSVSLLLHGKTLVSTLTFTSVAETTVTKTLTVPINSETVISSNVNDIPAPLTTMLTLSIRGDNGEITELVTAITVPLKPQIQIQPTIMATKVERDIRSTSRFDDNDERLFDDDEDYLGPLLLESSTDFVQQQPQQQSQQQKHHHHQHNHYRKISNNQNDNNYHQFISTSFITVDSQLQSLGTNSHPNFINTIFKGSNTDIYDANELSGDPDIQQDIDNESKISYRKRKLLQYSDNIYKESSDISNSFKPERTKQNRKFQRIRIKPKSSSTNNNNHSPGATVSESSRATEFNRLIGMNENTSPSINYGPDSFNSFRRQPLQLDQPLNLYSSVVASIPPISSTASYLLANNFQKPTYRKIKPQQSRRIVSSVRQVNPTLVNNQPPIQPSNVLSSNLMMVASSTIPSFIEIPNQFNHNVQNPPASHPSIPHHHHYHLQHQNQYPRLPSSPSLQIQPDPRHVIQHLNHDILPHKNRNNPVNQFNVHNVLDNSPLQSQGALPPFDTGSNYSPLSSNNDLDVLRSTLSSSSSSSVQQESSIHTPTIPLTYYTTFTYLTTVIRGQHTAHLSRESITSAITTRALDKSIVEIVRDSDGVIEPTRLRELGTKTKGYATTIYNALYQVQIYNEDLYKVIQKTYNKEVSFKPWQPSTTSYHPVFVTNHLDVPRETPVMMKPSSNEFNEFEFIRTSKLDSVTSPTTTFSLNTPFLSPSIIEPSYQPVENTAEPTPIIDSSLFTSSTTTRPSVRMSSSVLRKPYNPRYTQPLSRSRLRMRVSSRTSLIELSSSSSSLLSTTTTTTTIAATAETSAIAPSSIDSLVPIPTSLFSSYSISESSIESTISESTTTLSTNSEINVTSMSTKNINRPNLFRSKVIFRPRPGQTAQPFNSKMMRISSRLIRPSVTSLSSTSSDIVPTPTIIESSQTSHYSTSNDYGTDKVDHSDAARANKFVRVSNGVTLIISSRIPAPSRPFTFEPTLVTGAAVMMKNIIPEEKEPESSLTSNQETIEPTMTTETVEYLRTSTLLSTMTYFATLFNGSTSSITPIEDVKTEFITFPDTTTVTRPIHQTNSIVDGSITSMPNQILFNPTDYITSAPKLSSTSLTNKPSKYSTSLKSTYTTLTHYITLFHGSHTVLSSIEEISPTVVTETFGLQQTKPSYGDQISSSSINVEHHHHVPNIRFTQPSIDVSKQSKNLFGGLVPSVSTLFTTHTYFTTLFSGTTSIIQSREEITHSLITMYVPSSQMTQQSTKIMATSSTTMLPMSTEIPTINNDNEQQHFVELSNELQTPQLSTTTSDTNYVPDDPQIIIGSGSIQLEPSMEPEMTTSTLKDTSDAVVYFTNFILPSNVVESENTIDGAKGPINPLLNHGDLTLVADHNKPSNTKVPIPNPIIPTQPISVLVDSIQTQSPTIKPGAIIELTDLLDGANLAGNIGEAIKDIVQILAKGQKNKIQNHHPTPTMDIAAIDIDRTSVVKDMIMPPKDGATVSHVDDPVYIPINRPDLHNPIPNQEVFTSPTMLLPSSSIIDQTYIAESMPPVAYVPVEFTESIPSLSGSIPSISSSLDIQPSKSLTNKEMKTTSIFVKPSSTINSNEAPSTIIREPYFLPSKSPIFSTAGSGPSNNVPLETKYITSVESSPSTVVMTTTKVYYTRDSPLTITSSYTSTMPLRTVITTIVGSKTIFNTYSNEIKPTKSTLVPQSTSASDSNTRIHMQPQGGTSTSTGEQRTPFRPTRKPGVNRFKPPSRPTEPPKIFKTSHRPRQPYKPSPTPPPELELDQQRSGGSSFKKTTKFSYPKTTTRPAILDLDQCKPGCNAANKEICKEIDGKFKCDCRPGYIKKPFGNDVCFELQNFIVLVRVTKLGDQELEWNSILTNHTSELYQNLAKAARNQIDSAYIMINSMKENYIGADVMDINKAQDGHGVLVNMTIHLTESNNIDEDLIREELSRTLMMKPQSSSSSSSSSFDSTASSEQLPSPQQIYADLEDVIDFDECSSEEYNDCASSARCINEPGSYRCECLNGYPDLDLSFPGRMCASEIKACEFCYGRGDCYRDETGQISSCKCHRMYLGRRCEINGLLLAIFIPVIAILSIITICSIVYCCRKWRNRALVKGFRNFSAYGPNMIGSTLDRKAMLETSSDNSDPLRSHISYDGPGITANDATLSREYRRRREGEHPHLSHHHDHHQYNGEMVGASYPNIGASSIPYNFSTQFMIPRVRNASSTSLQTYGNNHVRNNHRHHYHGQNNNSHGHSHSHHHHHHNNNNQSSQLHHYHHHNHNHNTSSNYDYDGAGSGGSGSSGGVGNHRNHQYSAW